MTGFDTRGHTAQGTINMTQETLFLAIALIVIVVGSAAVTWAKKRRLKLPPGPVGLPLVGYLPFLGKESHKTFLRLGKKYKSDIIGLYLGKKYTVVLNEYEIMKETLSHPAAQDRSTDVFSIIPDLGFTVRNGEEWVQERRTCMGIVKELGIGHGNWESLMQEEIQSFLRELSSYKGRPVDITDMLCTSLISNFMGLLFGRKLVKGKEDEKLRTLNEYSETVLGHISPTFITAIFPGLRKLFELLKITNTEKVMKTINDFQKIVREEIENHKTGKEYENATDFIKLFQEAIDENRAKKSRVMFSEKALEGNICNLFLGASDTTSSSMEYLIYLLALYPEVQREMQREIDEVLGADRIPSYFDRDKIPYTFAVLMEAQRYTAMVVLTSPRRAISDFTIRGYTIPKGTEIIGNIWALQNDPKYWIEPEKFKPERFLKGPEKKLDKNPECFAQFSYGRRRCPGNVIAWMVILAYTTSILKKFDISMAPESGTNWEVVQGLVARLKMKPLCFVERNKM